MHATRRVTFPTILFALLTLTGAPGCDAPVEEELGTIEVRPGGGFSCSWCTLTGNSPIVNGASLADINLDVVNTDGKNTAGIKLRNGNTIDNMEFQLDVDPATERFVGRDAKNPGLTVVSDAGFLGAKIVLEMPDNGQTVHLEITDYDDSIPSWSDTGGMLTAYRAHYFSGGVLQPLCPTSNPDNQWFTLVLGETYEDNEVIARPGTVTLACVGEAAAKMKFMDYGPNGNLKPSEIERSATLRMITADYCGIGHSFTASGTRVAWRDSANTVFTPFSEDVLEAKWGPHGALCLNKPRHVTLNDVFQYCELPACDDNEFVDGVLWRTMLPK